ncbi:MAG: DsbA family oxidoreductase [Myxococcaceae bacterium]
MSRHQQPLSIVVYQDVLCAWCYVAQARLANLKTEFGNSVFWKSRPFPLRVREAKPTRDELMALLAELKRAKGEPEGAGLSPELWECEDPPRSSVPALAALEAAKLQGHAEMVALANVMQKAALEQGVNVTRPDVAFELAERVGLNMNKFSAAFGSSETRRLIIEEHRLASTRGVRSVPTLVIGRKWMVSGLRELGEYRDLIRDCLAKQEIAASRNVERVVH